jgi:hypothetical protein
MENVDASTKKEVWDSIMKCMNWQGYKTDEELMAVKSPQMCSCSCLYSLNHVDRKFTQSKWHTRVGTSSWVSASKLWRKIDACCALFTRKNCFPSEKRAANYPNPSMRKPKEVIVYIYFYHSFIHELIFTQVMSTLDFWELKITLKLSFTSQWTWGSTLMKQSKTYKIV